MSENSGALGLNLTTTGGVVLTSVNYTVSGPTLATPITGTIPVDASGATASVLVGALPAGDYTVTMSASDGTTNCSGSATFHVTAAQTVSVIVPLSCGAATTRGNARINGTFNACPIITSAIFAPLQLDVGGKINVSAAASDADSNPITFAWTATGGTFDAATAASTKYNCTVAGTNTLTVTVSDGQGCTTSLSGDVLCTTTEICGNGTVGAGEQCDPPNVGPGLPNTCSTTCQTLTVACGNGFLQPPTEQCEPPNTATCNSTCQNIVCGDGRVEGPEQCDPPAANLCSATCTNISFCGNGRVDPGETCEPPGTATCSATCGPVADACVPCQNSKCSGPVAACNAHEPGCDAILACIKTSGCAVGSTRDGAECYCGAGVDNDTCFSAADQTVPQGACRDVIAANSGLPLPLPLLVSQIFFDTGTSVGSAMQTIACDLASCKAECHL